MPLPCILGSCSRPSRTFDQHFGVPVPLDEDDLLSQVNGPGSFPNIMRSPVGYIRPWRSDLARRDLGSALTVDRNQFQANLDVQQLRPEDITVKTARNNTITIEGKHEEKQNEHGFISRQFVRRYVFPKNCDYDKVESKLSSDGVLSITAPIIFRNKEGTDIKNTPFSKSNNQGKLNTIKKSEEQDQDTSDLYHFLDKPV